ncbi:hypothetical protein [Halalkalibacter flavus]|uniref:hypothetical protein n=1 Tax=Halalkalibacter flavus TaxID=3090668 RepID=UPI002FCABF91
MKSFLDQLAKGLLFIEKWAGIVMKVCLDKPMENRKENYYEIFGKEMPKKRYEKERFYLFVFYCLMGFVVYFAVRGWLSL